MRNMLHFFNVRMILMIGSLVLISGCQSNKNGESTIANQGNSGPDKDVSIFPTSAASINLTTFYLLALEDYIQ